VQSLVLDGSASYDLKTVDATVAAGQTFTLNASLHAGDSLTFHAFAETDGHFDINVSGGTYNVTGGAQDDTFSLQNCSGTALGGQGNDTFTVTNANLPDDRIDGGGGLNNILRVSGTGGGGPYVLTDQSFIHISRLFLEGARIVESDGNVAAGKYLLVQIQSGSTTFDGSAETDGQFQFTINGQNNTITGGALGDSFVTTGFETDDVLNGGADNDGFSLMGTGFKVHGGNGNDDFSLFGTGGVFSGDAGADTFNFNRGNAAGGATLSYAGASDSTGANYDTVANFFFSTSTTTSIKFDLPGTVSAIDVAVTTGSLSKATFDSDLATDVGAGQLGTNDAVLFTADAGTLNGYEFLIVDMNGQAGYQAGEDLVIHIESSSPQGTLTTANFI
jgi:hypothetical protein